MEIYLREAQKEDISDIYKYINREYVKKYSKKEKEEWFRHKTWYKGIIDSEKHKLLLINDEKFHFKGFIKYDIDQNNEKAYINIFIPIDNRGKGIGKKAFAKSLVHLEKNIKYILAEVLTENTISLAFFKSIGFKIQTRDEFTVVLSKKLNYNL